MSDAGVEEAVEIPPPEGEIPPIPGDDSIEVPDGSPPLTRNGVILEAAFVDPSSSWPPADGEGKNAIELQASSVLLDRDGTVSLASSKKSSKSKSKKQDTSEDPTFVDVNKKTNTKSITRSKTTTVEEQTIGFRWCCKSKEAVLDTHTTEAGNDAALVEEKERAVEEANALKKAMKEKERERKKQDRYNRVPDGILIYKLDTATHTVELLSGGHSNTDSDSLLQKMVVARASPLENDKTRRGIRLTAIDGTESTLIACEQRTATSWLEAMDMMLGHGGRNKAVTKAAKAEASGADAGAGKPSTKQSSRAWAGGLKDAERDAIEAEYLNLASYSNKLIRAGALPNQKGKGGAGGIYYSMEYQSEQSDHENEALESIAKRRAVIKDSWDFYRMICSLLRDKRKYDEIFRKLQLDPVYPYLNSMTGLNDPGDAEYENADKQVLQHDLPEFIEMTKIEVANSLVKKAEEALPSLVEICKALAGSLGMEEVGVGPIKDPNTAIRKAEKKYEGDLLKVTDYCRALLVVKDFPSLLALLELARDSFGPLIRRVKLSTLKSDHGSLPGGYRDCKINLELKDHVCEIQVHLWPMWTVCGVDGFRHYRHCLEYSTDSFVDPYDALEGLDRKTLAELVVMAEEAVADIPLDQLEWYHEKFILDYFAETGLFMKHGLDVWAETTLRQLIKLRCESPEIGPDHHETMILNNYLERVLIKLKKTKEAKEISRKLKAYEERNVNEKQEAETSLWGSFFNAPSDVYDAVMDPNKKEREEEEMLRKEVKASKKKWRKIRQERFQFLDSAAPHQEEKKDYK
uniref:Uncharacterized protein n=1 Tax=Grammatophora oceanica TaxID=210454 RepID=A0A7S1YFD8_9STRA|mmetsp:Transcript_43960/g.65204  ORF Transcript_43960/g.65204 Transcript_43960/m.65204 type:complete len:803 (+) Transcript_43960:173-2581(+)